MLKLFLMLSLINGALSSLSNWMVYGMVDFIRKMFEGKETVNMMGMDLDLSLFMNTDKNFFLFQGILYVFSFTGALMMWKFRRVGFHFYTISQILLLTVASAFLTGMPFPIFDILLTGMFVYIYANNLKLMQ